MKTAAARGEYSKTAQRRDAILSAALEVFSESGYWNGSLRDIAARAGISQAGLTHHYPTKTDLLLAVLKRRDEAWGELLVEQQANGAGLLEAIVPLVDHNARTKRLTALFAVLSAEATSADHPAHEYFVSRTRAVFDAFEQAFRLALEHGELRDTIDPATEARRLMAVMDGLQVLWLYDDSHEMVPVVKAHLGSLLR